MPRHQALRARRSGTWEEYANQLDGEFAFVAGEAGGDDVDQYRRDDYADENHHATDQREDAEDGMGNIFGFIVFTVGAEFGVYGDKRSGENSFAKEVVQQVGNAAGLTKGIGEVGVPEVVGERPRSRIRPKMRLTRMPRRATREAAPPEAVAQEAGQSARRTGFDRGLELRVGAPLV